MIGLLFWSAAALWSSGATAAPGAAPCAITGESLDADVSGLRVRKGPSVASPVLGRLYPGMDPHVLFHDDNPTLAEGLVGAQFTIDRVAGDWLHITDIDPFTDGLGPNGELEPKANFGGSGWVHASKVRLLPLGAGVVRQEPHPRAAPVPPAILSDTYHARIVGCRGSWARIRSHKGEGAGWLESQSNKARAALLRSSIQARAKKP